MKRIFVSYPITDPDTIKRQMLSWTSRFNICAFLDNHSYDLPLHTAECLCAAGVIDAVEITAASQKNPSAVKGPEGQFRQAGIAGDDPAAHPAGDNPVVHPADDDPVAHPAGEDPVVYPAGDNGVVPPAGDDPVVHPAGDNPVVHPADDDPVAYPAEDNPVVHPTGEDPVVHPVAGIGAEDPDAGGNEEPLDRIDRFKRQYDGDWIFGHLGYGLTAGTVGVDIDLKGRRPFASMTAPDRCGSHVDRSGEAAGCVNHDKQSDEGAADRDRAAGRDRNYNDSDPVGFPDAFFFVPEVVIELGLHEIRIGALGRNADEVMQEILHEPVVSAEVTRRIAPVEARFSREEYIATVEALRQHILRGDCYEINFCQEFYSQPAHIDPVKTWFDLDSISPNPFSAFYRMNDRYLLCASPERYLKRSGDRLYSQPIKGTSPRFVLDPVADEASRDALFWSAKDRSENVMVVDLVRNDLSRVCRPDTVRVSELYGIYSFPQVHQMISTIEGDLEPGMGFKAVLNATFPMGSMTGAPKKRVVELIAQYERTPRGIFSGAVGYIRPGGDFDFNVVIRSILYNRASEYLCWLVGSGITFYSDPVLEYEECMIKAEGMKRALGL